MLQEHDVDYVTAGWASIHAAWVCDDDNLIRGAKKCRLRAIDLLRRAIQEGKDFSKQIGGEEALLVDLLRRSKQFKEAQSTYNVGMEKKPGKYIQDILLFQQRLITQTDATCHCTDEMMDSK